MDKDGQSDSRVWYLARDGNEHGPITEAELQKLIELSHLRATDLLWHRDLPDWVEFRTIAHATPDVTRPKTGPTHRAATSLADTIKYRAFLSYSHSDHKWAKWLHRQLESFRIDRELVGRHTSTGPIPKNLRPIFRDRTDFSAGQSLNDQTVLALSRAAPLVVICSPRAARSPHVNQEVRLFKEQGADRPIIPVIVDGQPCVGDEDCFPPAMKTAHGASAGGVATVLAADLREEGDGRSLGLAKIVARLLDLETDDVFRRAEREHRRKGRWRNVIVAVLASLCILAIGSAFLLRQELRRNEVLLDRTLERASTLVNKTVVMSDQVGLPRALSLGLLVEAERMFADMSELGSDSPKLVLRKAWMLIEFARTYEVLGRSEEQRKRAAEAEQIMARLLQHQPSNTEAQRVRGVALNELGDALKAQGFTEQAFNSYQAAFKIALAQHQARPTNHSAFDLRVSLERLGRIAAISRNFPRAIEAARWSLTIAESLSRNEPDNKALKRSVSNAHTDLGDLLLASGNPPAALQHHRLALIFDQGLAAVGPDKTSAQASLSVSHERIGDLEGVTGDFTAALGNYRAAKTITEGLAKADPANTIWQNNLSLILSSIGDTQFAQGEFIAGKESYNQSLLIRGRLAKTDPANALWQYLLAANHFRVALAEALSTTMDRHRAADVAKSMYALKHSMEEVHLKRFAQLTIDIFARAKANDEARRQLKAAADIVRTVDGAGRLAPYYKRWGEIFQAGLTAMD